MNDNKILSDIRSGFDRMAAETEEHMADVIEKCVNGEQKAVVIQQKNIFTAIIPAVSCAAVILGISAGTFLRGTGNKNNITYIADETAATTSAVTETVAETSVPVTSSASVTSFSSVKTENDAETQVVITAVTSKPESVSYTEKKETEHKAISVYEETVQSSVHVYEITAEPESEITEKSATETTLPETEIIPVTEYTESESAAEITTVTEETSSVISETVTFTEETDEFSDVHAVLAENPLWSGNGYDVYEDFTGKDLIYTVENPDRYIIKVYFGENSESFTLSMAVRMRIVTIDDLIEAGLPYTKTKSVR